MRTRQSHKPPNPHKEVDFLFDRMFYWKGFPVFPAQKRTIWVISAFENNFPVFAFDGFLNRHCFGGFGQKANDR